MAVAKKKPKPETDTDPTPTADVKGRSIDGVEEGVFTKVFMVQGPAPKDTSDLEENATLQARQAGVRLKGKMKLTDTDEQEDRHGITTRLTFSADAEKTTDAS